MQRAASLPVYPSGGNGWRGLRGGALALLEMFGGALLGLTLASRPRQGDARASGGRGNLLPLVEQGRCGPGRAGVRGDPVGLSAGWVKGAQVTMGMVVTGLREERTQNEDFRVRAVNPPLWGSLECSRALRGGDSLWWTGREAHAGWTQRPEAGPPGLEDKRWLASGLPGLPWASEGPGGETSEPQQHLPNQIVSCSPQQGGAGPDTRSREEESQDLLPAGLP